MIARDPGGARRRRHLAARRHQGARHVRRERRQEPDGGADVRHQRAVVHVVGDVVARRCRSRHARSAGEPGRGDGRRCRVRAASVDSTSITRSTRSTRSDRDHRTTVNDPVTSPTAPGPALGACRDRSSGNVAIVTGAASGMGRATAHLFADEGARVVVADLGAERVAAVVDEIVAVHGADCGARRRLRRRRTRRSCTTLVERTVEWAGRLDIVVNNAGISLINSAFQAEGEFETQLGAHARRQPHRPRPADPARRAAHDRGGRRSHRQHRVDRGDRDDRPGCRRTPRPRRASSG